MKIFRSSRSIPVSNQYDILTLPNAVKGVCILVGMFCGRSLTYDPKGLSKQKEIIGIFAGGVCGYLLAKLAANKEVVSYRSVFDNAKVIDKGNWAVTLVRTGVHLSIVIEGIKEGKKFASAGDVGIVPSSAEKSYAHTVYYGVIESNIACDAHSDTWLVTAEKVKKMIKSIESEVDKPFDYGIFGNQSIFSGFSHNCVTWAIQKMKILDIHLDLGFFSILASHPGQVTNEFFCAII